ncbi:MAG TPA: hypothetical protein PKN09_02950 [Novosphingobium sp.]|nr:hypothetical protein [Novosphingobium sp.]
MKPPPTLLATGFVVDAPHEGTIFPSAGGNSANPKVQAIYWRCLVALFASARITNPGQRLALFCNVRPPVIDGVDLAMVLERYGVELRLIPLTARLAKDRTAAWGNVLYFFDILTALEAEPDDLRFALVDSDVLVTGTVEPLWALLDQADFAGYVVDTAEDEPVNGMTRRGMAEAAGGLSGRSFAPIPHFGGELFATTIGEWKRNRQLYDRMLDQASRGTGPAAGVLTEEHIYSIAFALQDRPVADAQRVIKRIWTSPRHNTARPGDEALPLWHLPAEKRYGLADFYAWLAAQDFPTALDPAMLRTTAMRLCAVPRKRPVKWLRDGVRQVAAKLGLRQ